MNAENNNDFEAASKKVWMVYSAIVLMLIIFLVTVVAGDMEEILFYAIMTGAASYVFRPGDKFIQDAVKHFFDIDPPPGEDNAEE